MAFAISIHALREEGDSTTILTALRHLEFLSTPSARRATRCFFVFAQSFVISIHALREEGDESQHERQPDLFISIHALREEGDCSTMCINIKGLGFLSTPSARRATPRHRHCQHQDPISIHALREEGDSKNRDKISIFKQIIQHSARI